MGFLPCIARVFAALDAGGAVFKGLTTLARCGKRGGFARESSENRRKNA